MAILRWALSNALDHGGRADPRAVLGKVLAERPKLRPRAKELKPEVWRVVEEVNRLTPKQQSAKLEELGLPELVKPKRRGLPELPRAERGVVTRFAPNPNGPLHLGHIRAALLSHEYARRYGGRFILRFEDTNPENALLEMYELIREDLRWLGIEWDEEYIQSDRLEIYYRYARELLERGKAYVCTCPPARFRGLRDRGEPCPCRALPELQHLERWGAMLEGGYKAGQAVVRIKTDLSHPNPAVRDWPALRIVEAPHPRVGGRHRVWPLYNFSVAVDDHEMGITHVIRGKEHEVNELRQRTLFEHMGWDYPLAIQYGRLTLAGAVLSKTQTMQGIKAGKFSGYDDPRLGTIAALRRRGFLPQAIKRTILDLGPTPVDASLSWETLASHNRKLVDPKASRYFFVPAPVKLEVQEVPAKAQVRVRLHPSKPKGERVIPLQREDGALVVFIPKEDLEGIKEGEIFRLKDLMNVRLLGKEPARGRFEGFELADVLKIQWVSGGALQAEVLKPDGALEKGLVEPAAGELKPGELVQFERYGFVRVERVKPRVMAVFTHR